MRSGYRHGLTGLCRSEAKVNALFLQIDRQFGIALVLSVALHAFLFAVLVDFQEAPTSKIVSSINVRLSTAITPAPPSETTSPDVLPRSSDPVLETAPKMPKLAPVEAAPRRTPAPVAVMPQEPPPFNLDPDSLQAFIGSATKPQPPSLKSEFDVSEQYRARWHQRVQRIGQLNYPEAATKMKLTGQLTLNVAINSDGSLDSVGIAQTSGYDQLDIAALEIVRQSSPFEPLPPNLPRSNGHFRFDSTWEFRR